MNWVDLKIHLAPIFMNQINEVSKNYMSNLSLINYFLLFFKNSFIKRIKIESRPK